MNALLLANPAAGRSPLGEDGGQELLSRLAKRGFDCDLVLTEEGADPVPELDLSDKELLIIMGGDGTLHQALPQVVRWGRPVGLLAMGTANVLARELALPRDLSSALDVLERGRRGRIYLGRGGGHWFHTMAGVGLDSHIIRRVRFKRALGRAAYWLSGFISFWSYPLRPFEIALDGERHEATFAVVSRVRYYGGGLLMAPGADPRESRFQTVLFHGRVRLQYFGYLAGVLAGRHTDFRSVTLRKARKVEVAGPDSLEVQMDGEVVSSLPITFEIEPEPVEFIVP